MSGCVLAGDLGAIRSSLLAWLEGACMHGSSGTDRAQFLCLVGPLNLGGVEFPFTAGRTRQAYREREGDLLDDG